MNLTAQNLAFPPPGIMSQRDEESGIKSPLCIQEWCGRGVATIQKGMSNAAHAVFSAAQSVFSSINHLAADTNVTASIFRRLDAQVLRFVEHLRNTKETLSQLGTFIRHNVAIIDFVQLINDIDYFVAGRFKEKRDEQGKIEKLRDNNVVIAGKLSFTVADLGGSLLWLQDLGFISLSNAAKAIGNIRLFSLVPKAIASIPLVRDLKPLATFANFLGDLRVFSFVNHLNCLSITLRAIDLGYALFAIDAGRRLVNADNKYKMIAAGLDLSCYLAELTLSTIIFAGVTNVVGLGVTGAACVTLIVTSFLYRMTHEKQLRPTLQLPAQAVVELK